MEEGRISSPSSASKGATVTPYTVQTVTSLSEDKDGEREPLLGLRRDKDTESEVESRVVNKKSISKNNLKKFVTAVCLWLAYLFVSAAYSLFGPFFPGEVTT